MDYQHWLDNLSDLLAPHIYRGLRKLYDDVRRVSEPVKNGKTLLCFQLALSRIKDLSTEIDNDYNVLVESLYRMDTNEQWLAKLIEKVFVSYARIALEAEGIKVNKQSLTERHINPPSNKAFLHKVYINAARTFWMQPQLFWHRYSSAETQSNNVKIFEEIKKAIAKTVRENIGLDKIFRNYDPITVNEPIHHQMKSLLDEGDSQDSQDSQDSSDSHSHSHDKYDLTRVNLSKLDRSHLASTASAFKSESTVSPKERNFIVNITNNAEHEIASEPSNHNSVPVGAPVGAPVHETASYQSKHNSVPIDVQPYESSTISVNNEPNTTSADIQPDESSTISVNNEPNTTSADTQPDESNNIHSNNMLDNTNLSDNSEDEFEVLSFNPKVKKLVKGEWTMDDEEIMLSHASNIQSQDDILSRENSPVKVFKVTPNDSSIDLGVGSVKSEEPACASNCVDDILSHLRTKSDPLRQRQLISV